MNVHMCPSLQLLSFRCFNCNQILLLYYRVISWNITFYDGKIRSEVFTYGLTGVGDYSWSSCGIMVSLMRAQWTIVMFFLNNAKARIYVLKAEGMNYIQASTRCSLTCVVILITTFVASSSFSFLGHKPTRLLYSCNDIVHRWHMSSDQKKMCLV